MPCFADAFCKRYQRLADFMDAREADEQAELLRANGLQALNDKLLASPSRGPSEEVLDVVAEHNIAAMVLRRGFTDVQYEPPSMPRPVDVVGKWKGRWHRIEVKRLDSPEHDQLQTNVMNALNRALESDDDRVLISLQIEEAFEAEDINPLLRHVKEKLRQWRAEEVYCFSSDEECLARYTFQPSAKRQDPLVGIVGDAGIRDVTGDENARVRGRVKRAYSKFKSVPDEVGVHLVALETDNRIQPPPQNLWVIFRLGKGASVVIQRHFRGSTATSFPNREPDARSPVRSRSS